MHLTGELLIGGESRKGTNGEIKGINPATGEILEPAFGGATRGRCRGRRRPGARGLRRLPRPALRDPRDLPGSHRRAHRGDRRSI
ncbi:hypothetical protein ACRAWD_14115 [Caulobacter segnis]